MKRSTKDKVAGSLHELKGAAKVQVGRITNNPSLTAEGQGEKLGGKVQRKVGQVEAFLKQ